LDKIISDNNIKQGYYIVSWRKYKVSALSVVPSMQLSKISAGETEHVVACFSINRFFLF
jgi:hypothetical protein